MDRVATRQTARTYVQRKGLLAIRPHYSALSEEQSRVIVWICTTEER